MRRKDREITDISDILSIINKCDSCNLGLSLNDMPYVIPLNFGYEYEDGKLSLYFHGASEGKKLDIIRQNSNACFSMDAMHELVESENGAEFTMRYESVTGYGKIEILEGHDEKRAGLDAIMKHYAPNREFSYPDRVIEILSVLKLTVDEFFGKRNKMI